MLFALGLGDSVVAVTHECDYPAEAAELPQLTRSVVPEGLSAAEIDREVRERTERGAAIYELDADELRDLEPDLIVTQAVCEVCAVSFEDVTEVAQSMEPQPPVLSLDPTTLGEVIADIRRLADATHVPEEGERLVAEMGDRIDWVTAAVADAEEQPAVLALEWLDPAYIGGHWVPQMIEIAGGIDVLGFAGERSRIADWREIETAAPAVVVSMPCGYGDVRACRPRRPAGRPARRRRGRVILLLAPRPAAGGRDRAAGARAPPRSRGPAAARANGRARRGDAGRVKRATQDVVVDGSPQDCFDALVDYESFPDWQGAVTAVEVITRDRDGRGKDVEFQIDAKVRKIHYRLRYSYDPPRRIWWDYLDGDVKDVDGEMLLEDQGDGTTLATYSLVIDPGVWLPGPILKVLNDQVMKGSVEDLKRRVENAG
jgi:iron complex transport system substrate-binding protein